MCESMVDFRAPGTKPTQYKLHRLGSFGLTTNIAVATITAFIIRFVLHIENELETQPFEYKF